MWKHTEEGGKRRVGRWVKINKKESKKGEIGGKEKIEKESRGREGREEEQKEETRWQDVKSFLSLSPHSTY